MLAIRSAEPRDAQALAELYNFFVVNSIVTFEEEPVPVGEMARRIDDVRATGLPWLVAEESGELLGYAHAKPWRPRSAYRFSVEITVYVNPRRLRGGIGSALYGQLFALLQARGLRAIIGGIALPNDASVALHEKFGMQKVAHFQAVGFKRGQWIDVAYWQRILPS